MMSHYIQKKVTAAILAFLSAAVLVGCNDKKSDVREHPTTPGVYVDETSVAYIADLSYDDAVLFVNGEKITRRDFENLLELRDKIWRLRTKNPLVSTADEMEEFRRNAGPAILMELIHHAMFRQYAREIGISPTKEQIDAASSRFLSVLNMPNHDIDAIARSIGGGAGELFRMIPVIDAQDALLRQSVTTNDLDSVSEDEIKARIAFVEKFDANADNMNARAKERLLAAKQAVLAGADFAEEAKKIADAVRPEFGSVWGTFEIQEFPSDEDLHKWLLTASVGDISEPVDTEDGIAIVKVLAKDKGDAPEGVTPPDSFQLARITVKACEKMLYQDRNEMTAQLLKWKREDAQRALGTMLVDRAVIEYPHGTNLFDRVSDSQGE